MSIRILVVEDDLNTRTKLAYVLQQAGYLVTQAPDGETALDILKAETFTVVLTDIVMGDVDGVAVLHAARSCSCRPQVILLTGQGSLETCMAAVHEGASEYLLKPCPTEQLITSVERAVERHEAERKVREAATTLLATLTASDQRELPPDLPPLSPFPPHSPFPTDLPPPDRIISVGDLSIGSSRRQVHFRGQRIPVTPVEYALLSYLARCPGQVCRYADIVRHTHNLDTSDADAQMLLGQHIRNLRKKLDPTCIETVRGIGYLMVSPTSRPESNM